MEEKNNIEPKKRKFGAWHLFASFVLGVAITFGASFAMTGGELLGFFSPISRIDSGTLRSISLSDSTDMTGEVTDMTSTMTSTFTSLTGEVTDMTDEMTGRVSEGDREEDIDCKIKCSSRTGKCNLICEDI